MAECEAMPVYPPVEIKRELDVDQPVSSPGWNQDNKSETLNQDNKSETSNQDAKSDDTRQIKTESSDSCVKDTQQSVTPKTDVDTNGLRGVPTREKSTPLGDILGGLTDNEDLSIPSYNGSNRATFAKPMKCGWYREIVVRGTAAEGKRVSADVYYFTPSGRKLRSMPMITEYLQSSSDSNELTPDCFTFKKATVHKPPFEVVRLAGKQKNPKKNITIDEKRSDIKPGKVTISVSKSSVTPSISVLKPNQNKNVRYFPKGISHATNDAKYSPLANQRARTTEVVFSAMNPKIITVVKSSSIVEKDVDKKHSSEEEVDIESVNHSPSENSTPESSYKPVKARKGFCRTKTTEKSVTSSDIKASGVVKKMSVCGMDCPGSEGLPPSLVCKVCQRLYHHQCVGILDVSCVYFCCTECSKRIDQGVNDPLEISNFENSSTPAPQTSTTFMTPTLLTNGLYHTVPRTTTLNVTPMQLSSIPYSASPQFPMLQSSLSTSVNSKAIRLPPPLTRAPCRGQVVISAQHSPRVTPVAAPRTPVAPVTIATPSVANSTLVTTNPTVNSTSSLPSPCGSVKDNRPGQYLNLPPEVMASLKKDSPIDIAINGKMIKVHPNNFFDTPSGMKILLPPDSFHVQSSSPLNIGIPQASLKSMKFSEKKESVTKSTAASASVGSSSNRKSFKANMKKGPASSKVKKPPRKPAKTGFDHQLLSGFEFMNNVFEYLQIPDLLNARLVCKKWKNIIDRHECFLNVSIDDRVVNHWKRFGNFLIARRTESLDLSGLKLRGKFTREWTRFTYAVPKLKYLTKLTLGPCPPSALYSIAQELLFLESLTAEHITETNKEPNQWYTNAVIDLSKLSTLRYLKELRLRGLAGLESSQTAYSNSGRLSQLKKLEKLSLTSLKNVDGLELSFLAGLSELKELDIGDCDTWTEDTYAYLSSIQLKKLHLENGGASSVYLSCSLPNWQTLRELDLIMMAVDERLARGLSKLTNLESLSICPDTRNNDALTNRNTLLAVRDLKHLKYFLWCAVMMSDGETDDTMEFLRHGIEDSLFYGETGQPPPDTRTDDVVPVNEIKDGDSLGIDEEIALIEGRSIIKNASDNEPVTEDRQVTPPVPDNQVNIDHSYYDKNSKPSTPRVAGDTHTESREAQNDCGKDLNENEELHAAKKLRLEDFISDKNYDEPVKSEVVVESNDVMDLESEDIVDIMTVESKSEEQTSEEVLEVNEKSEEIVDMLTEESKSVDQPSMEVEEENEKSENCVNKITEEANEDLENSADILAKESKSDEHMAMEVQEEGSENIVEKVEEEATEESTNTVNKLTEDSKSEEQVSMDIQKANEESTNTMSKVSEESKSDEQTLMEVQDANVKDCQTTSDKIDETVSTSDPGKTDINTDVKNETKSSLLVDSKTIPPIDDSVDGSVPLRTESINPQCSIPKTPEKNSADDSEAVNGKHEQWTPKKRERRQTNSLDLTPRRSGRKRKLKSNEDAVAFITLETLISILEYHLPDTDIRVDPITMMR